MIYLDNAATTITKPIEVIDAISQSLTDHLGNPSRGTYLAAQEAFKKVEDARAAVKNLFNAEHYECAFSMNATESLNMAIKGLLPANAHVITTSWEHNAVLRPLYQLADKEVRFDVIPSQPVTGTLCYDALEQLLQSDTKAVICNVVSNVTGNVIDLNRIKAFCKAHDLMLIIDCSQAAGVIPIDLSDDIVTAACFTGHKSLFGPMGVGGMCIRRDAVIDPLITGGDGIQSFNHEAPKDLPERIEAGTLNVPNIIGLAAGIRYVMEHPEQSEREYRLTHWLRSKLLAMKNVEVYGDGTSHSIVSFNIKDTDSAITAMLLDENEGIMTRSGYHCAPLMHEALGTSKRGTVRLALSMMTTEEEIMKTCQAIQNLAAEAE